VDKDEFVDKMNGLTDRLYRTALVMLADEAAAADALGEAVYRGLKAAGRLRQPEFINTWMTRILINECRKEMRRRRIVQPVDELPETAVEQFDALPIKDAVRRLPAGMRDVIILRFFTGLTLAETARTLKIPPGTAATWHRRALELLRIELL